MVSGTVTDLQLVLLARKLRATNLQISSIAPDIHSAAEKWRDVGRVLRESHESLRSINWEFLSIIEMASASYVFCERCRNATEEMDLSEMIRQRDELKEELNSKGNDRRRNRLS
jgi:hypothetical protein